MEIRVARGRLLSRRLQTAAPLALIPSASDALAQKDLSRLALARIESVVIGNRVRIDPRPPLLMRFVRYFRRNFWSNLVAMVTLSSEARPRFRFDGSSEKTTTLLPSDDF